MLPPGISRKEVIAFGVVSSITLVYVIVRAALVPLVHDEAVTFLYYILSGEFLPGKAHWDAANHVLNSGFSIASVKLYGEGILAMRLPSVLAYPIYALAALWLSSLCRDRVVRWCLLLALLMCPFLLDFFALCRGYGLGMAFFLVALSAACFAILRPTRHALMVLLWASGPAIWADMALIPALALLLTITLLLLIPRREFRALLNWSVLGSGICSGALWVFGILHAQELSKKGLLYHGSREGFLEVTLQPLFRFIVGSESLILIGSVVLAAAVMVGLAWAKRTPDLRTPFKLVAINLIALVVGTVILARFFHINYPEDRAALQFVVLFIVLVGFAVDRLEHGDKRWRWAVLILLLLPVRTILLANLERTLLWSEQSLPAELLDAAQAEQDTSDRQLTLGAYHQHALVLKYADRQRGNGLPQTIAFDAPDTIADLILVDERFTDELSSAYQRVVGPYHDGLSLFKRRPVLFRQRVFDQAMPDQQTSNEFINLPTPALVDLPNGQFLVRLQARLEMDLVKDMHFVVSTEVNGISMQYSSEHLIMIQGEGRTHELDMIHLLEDGYPRVDRVAIYLWNPEQQQVQLSQASVIISKLEYP